MEEILKAIEDFKTKVMAKLDEMTRPKTSAEILAGWPVSNVAPTDPADLLPVIKVELSPTHPDYTIIAAAEDPANLDYIKSETKPAEFAGMGLEWVKSNTLCGIIWERTKI